MGQFLLTAGAKGKRFSLPHSRIMMHQPLGGTNGQASDIEIYTKEMIKIRETLYSLISKHSGQDVNKIRIDADRDNWMSPEDALNYGIIDKILQ
jgi:ATP-dependent Clp protease protease subunit